MRNSSSENIKTPTLSILLYTASVITGIFAITSLITKIFIFKNAFSYYQAQGYTSDLILEELLPSQLLPGIFESLGLYAGIALLLFAAGVINKRLAHYLTPATASENSLTQENTNTIETDTDNNTLIEADGDITDEPNTSAENPKEP